MAALVMLSAAVFLGLLLPSSMADNVLDGGGTLYTGQSLTQGDYTFIMQSDCNLVLYDKGRAVWASKTNGQGRNCVLRMQTDGNLVVYDGSNRPVWASNTGGSRGYYILVLQRDRNVVIYGCPRWASGTNTADSEGVVIVKSDWNDTSFNPQVVVPAADEPSNRKIAMVTNN
ncbi:mannose-specific lectin-like [Curcuma longa]|uniref:mannose-specific lectin-like n=1 Tax=Curcuma longa TaxID=136217 RepID=UPI003D9E7D3D